MDTSTYQLNLHIAWLGILLGFVSGSLIGLNFKFFKKDWQGGYAGLRRRMMRLGHIAFFGLAIVNMMFHFTTQSLNIVSQTWVVASWAFVVGAIAMPICCFTMAVYPRLKNLFYFPVISLIIGGLLTFWEVIKS